MGVRNKMVVSVFGDIRGEFFDAMGSLGCSAVSYGGGEFGVFDDAVFSGELSVSEIIKLKQDYEGVHIIDEGMGVRT